MVSNKLTLLAASAALVDTALGFNSHRHLHNNRNVDKRAYETDWVTEWVTVWVTPGVENDTPTTSTAATTTTTAEAVVDVAADNVVSTTTSTVVLAATSSSVAEVAAENVVEPQTTLSTAVKSSSVAAVEYTTTSQEVVVEAAATSSTQAAVVVTTSSAASSESTTSSSSSSSSSSSYSGSSGITNKRGMSYNDATLADTFSSSCTNCGWAYNWGAVNDGLDDSIVYIPQLWGPTHSDGWNANALAAIEAGAGAVFSFNEPDISSQAALSVSDAATYHVEYMNPLKGKALIGAPAVSNSGTEGQGLSYLSQWIDACEDLDEPCHYDFCNIHWYSEAQYSDTLFTQLKAAYDLCGKPIWLTEFAPTDTDESTISSFLEEVIPKLEALDYVAAYAYFMVKTGVLMTDSTSLSTYGQVYAEAST